MSVVKIEFQIKGGDKLVTTNEKIIKQLVEQGAKYKVLEGAIEDIIETQNDQVESVEEVTKSYKEVLAEYKENEKQLKALAIAGDTTSEEYRKLSQSVGAARAQLEEANRAANNQKGIFDATLGTLGGVTAGFAAVQGAIGLLGVESEETQKALLKVQSALALTQGIKQFQEAIPAFKNLSTIVKGPVIGAFNGLKAAIGATGIGLIVIAVGLLISNWDKLVDALRTAFPAFGVIENFFKNFKNIALGAVSAVLEGFKVVGDVLKNLFKGNIRQAVADAKSFGSRVGQAYQEGFNEAVEKEQTKARVKQLQDDLAFAQARGEKTLQLEKDLIEERLKLVKKGSDEEKELLIDLERVKTQIRKQSEAEIKASEDRITAAKRVDAERRVALMREGLQKELAQLRLSYQEQRREAIKNGEDLRLIDQLYNKERNKLVENFAKEYIKTVNEIYVKLNAITTGSYLVEEAALERFQDEQRRLLKEQIDNLVGVVDVLQKNQEQREKINEEEIKNERRKLNKQKKILEEQIKFKQSQIAVEQELLEQADLSRYADIDENLRKLSFEVRKAEEELTSISSRLEKINLQEEFVKQFSGASEEIKKENDKLTNFRLAQIQQEDLFAAEIAAIRSQKLVDGLKSEIDIREKSGEDVLQLQLQLFDEEFKIFTENEKRKVRQREEILARIAGEDVDAARKAGEEAAEAYERLTEGVAKAAKERIQFSNEVTKIDKQNNQESLNAQIAYYNELNGISAKNTTDRKKQEAEISQKFERDELQRQRKLLDQKLAAAEKAFTKESEEYKKLQLEKAKLEKRFFDTSLKELKGYNKAYKNASDFLQKEITQQAIQVLQQALSTLAEIAAFMDSKYQLMLAQSNAFYDEEVRKNEEARNAEVNNYALSREEQQNINQRYALQETEIEERRAEEIKKIEKKRADTAFKFKIAEIIGNGALAFTRALAELGPIAGPIAAGLVATTVAFQRLQAINQRKITQQLEDGGLLVGASHSQGGIPVGNTGIEVEGLEYVVNKKSTAKYLPLLEAINNDKSMTAPRMPRTNAFLERGGMLRTPQATSQSTVLKTYVVTEEVSSKQAMTARIKRDTRF